MSTNKRHRVPRKGGMEPQIPGPMVQDFTAMDKPQTGKIDFDPINEALAQKLKILRAASEKAMQATAKVLYNKMEAVESNSGVVANETKGEPPNKKSKNLSEMAFSKYKAVSGKTIPIVLKSKQDRPKKAEDSSDSNIPMSPRQQQTFTPVPPQQPVENKQNFTKLFECMRAVEQQQNANYEMATSKRAAGIPLNYHNFGHGAYGYPGNSTSPKYSAVSAAPEPQSNSEVDDAWLKELYEEIETKKQQSHSEQVSAFHRLGPVVEPPPIGNSLKINVTVNDNDARKVEVETKIKQDLDLPLWKRESIRMSTDPIVIKYLRVWPWRDSVRIKRESFPTRASKDVMMQEIEDMKALCYDNSNAWVRVVAKGYPSHYRKEDVLDTILKFLGDMMFIPSYIEFTRNECVFVITRCPSALTYLHVSGLLVAGEDATLSLQIGLLNTDRMSLGSAKAARPLDMIIFQLTTLLEHTDSKLDLSQFFMAPDNSHFVYFPLARPANQRMLLEFTAEDLPWAQLTTLNLSNNKLTAIDGFNLARNTPRLKNLDLGNNKIQSVSKLACLRGLCLDTLVLEGNPLVYGFIGQQEYIDVVRMIFPTLMNLDGVKLPQKGVPECKKNYCLESDFPLVNEFLKIFLALMESEERHLMVKLYKKNAMLSVTTPIELRRAVKYSPLRDIFKYSRRLQDEDEDAGVIEGAEDIAKVMSRWPKLDHDVTNLTVDVCMKMEDMYVIRITGLLKVLAESLAYDEPVAEFSRTFVLHSTDGVEYKIANDMFYLAEAKKERINCAFEAVMHKAQGIDTKIDDPDDTMKDNLVDVMVDITKLKVGQCMRSLEIKDWDLRKALQLIMKLEKANTMHILDVGTGVYTGI